MKSINPAGLRSAQFVFSLVLLLSAVGIQAQQATLSVQGVLTKADGTAVDDNTYNIEFSLWKSESSTNLADRVYKEDITVQTTGGVYSVILGLAQPLTAPFDQPYWLGVKYGSTELLPRPRLTSAPFALSLLGQNNTFPSTGTVVADDIRTNSYTFKTGTTSGLFWNGETDIKHNGNSRILIGGNGTNYVTGPTIFNNETRTTGRVSTTDGFGYMSGGGTPFSTGLFFDGTEKKASIYTEGTPRFHAWDDGKNYYRATNGHVFDVGDVSVSTNVLTNGRVRAQGGFGNGFSFNYPGVIDDSDSGLFGTGDGGVALVSNNAFVIDITPPQGTNTSNENSWAQTSVRIQGLQRGPDRRNVQWDETNYRLFFDSSSRRYKSNIQPLVDDFTKILQVQPKTYDRPDAEGIWEIGYIAEEIDSLGLHRVVEYSNGVPDGVNYEKMILYVTEIVKAQYADIENMKAEIAALKAEKKALQQENETLRTDGAALQSKQAAFSAQLDALANRIKSLEGTAGNR